MRPGRVIESVLTAFLLLTFEGGCSLFSGASRGGSAEKSCAISADSTPLYRYSPRQGRPDQILVRGTPVTLIRASSEFCKVQLPGGERGFVASKDIATAPREVAAVTTAPPDAASSSAWRAELPQPRSVAPPPPLPEFEPTPFPETINPRD
jgi:hypothetical protein